MKTQSRGNFLAAGAKAAGLGLALAAALIVTPGPSPRAQTERPAPTAKPREVKLGIKQRDKDTGYLKISLTESLISGVKATDSAGTRDFKPLDTITMPCKDEQKECKTVELESGILVGVCYCKNTQTAILLPAIQSAREAGRRSTASNATSSSVKVFSGSNDGVLLSSKAQQSECWGDVKLKMSICPQTAAPTR